MKKLHQLEKKHVKGNQFRKKKGGRSVLITRERKKLMYLKKVDEIDKKMRKVDSSSLKYEGEIQKIEGNKGKYSIDLDRNRKN